MPDLLVPMRFPQPARFLVGSCLARVVPRIPGSDHPVPLRPLGVMAHPRATGDMMADHFGVGRMPGMSDGCMEHPRAGPHHKRE
ncbi:MAG: hypothetical protein M1568_02115 [Acidobacteria bacterium]|nr:hypothetical protein [Acidobacteriota bacterium]